MTAHLFYLEDDDALASITIKAFERRGYKVNHVSRIGDVNSQYFEEEYSHALLDLKLDDGNSLKLIPQLAEQYPNIKILLLTGYASIATAVQAIKLGAHNYLAKPASIDEILLAFGESHDGIEINDEQMSLKRLEWEKIQQALAENDGNISATAKQLNMYRRTLQRKLSKRPVSK